MEYSAASIAREIPKLRTGLQVWAGHGLNIPQVFEGRLVVYLT
jgi:pyridoxine 5'-phosphate synthase PdxJ